MAWRDPRTWFQAGAWRRMAGNTAASPPAKLTAPGTPGAGGGGGIVTPGPTVVPGLLQPAGLEGAARFSRLGYFQPAAAHINTLMYNAGPTLNARARWLVRNNCYAAAAVRSWESATVGAGIVPISEIDEQRQREDVDAAFLEWTDEADAEGLTEFYGIQKRVSREVFIAGECFLRFRVAPADLGHSVPLQLQLLPSEQLPMYPGIEAVPLGFGFGNEGGRIRLGIEFARDDPTRRVAYWFSRHDPTDGTVPLIDLIAADLVERIPASEILHIFEPTEAGQLRGLSRLAPAIVKLFSLDSWDDAELERQRQQSVYAATIETPEERDQQTSLLVNQRPAEDAPTLVPGTILELYGGEKFNFTHPPGVSGTYEPFQYRVILALAAALGIPYAEISADLNRTTYASSRAGLLAFRTAVETFQHSVLVFQMVRPVWQQWMNTAALVRGAMPFTAAAYVGDLRRYRRMKAITPRTPWVDPLKDIQALKLALDAQLISPREAVAANGYDYVKTMREIAEDNAVKEELGIALPVPGWGSRAGQAVTPATPSTESTEAA